MNSIMNIITEANLSLIVIMVVIVVIAIGMGIHLLKSPIKLKWNSITTLFVISILSFGLTFTPQGAAKVKESQRGKTSRTVTTDTKKTEDTKKTDKTDNTKKNQTQKSR